MTTCAQPEGRLASKRRRTKHTCSTHPSTHGHGAGPGGREMRPRSNSYERIQRRQFRTTEEAPSLGFASPWFFADLVVDGSGLSACLANEQMANDSAGPPHAAVVGHSSSAGLAGGSIDRRSRQWHQLGRCRSIHSLHRLSVHRATWFVPGWFTLPNAEQHRPAAPAGKADYPRPETHHAACELARPGRLRKRHLLRSTAAGAT